MKYKIIVQVETEVDERGYSRYDEIYSQIKEDLNILEVIKSVNAIGEPTWVSPQETLHL